MNRLMIVFRANGTRYFSTDAVRPADETREENYWRALGYAVEFKEVAK